MAKKVEVTEIVNYSEENKIFLTQLTKRNEQYVYNLDKALQAASVSDNDREKVKFDIMTELVEAQKTGKTARQLYGTVSEQVKRILNGPTEDLTQPSPDWQLFVDGALFLGSLFMIISGFNTQQSLGIMSLILNYIFAGLAMLFITKSSPRYTGEIKFKNRQAIFKYIAFTALGLVIWMGGMTLTLSMPLPFNVVLPGIYYIATGLATMALRFYLKKVWKLRGTAF